MSRSAALAAPSILSRGVHPAEYLLGGCRVLQAIDRHGNCRKRVKIKPEVDEEVVLVWLEGLLERLDPPPLQLMPPDRTRTGAQVLLNVITSRNALAAPTRPLRAHGAG